MTIQNFLEKYAIDRHNTHSLKWDELEKRYGDPDLISMWVADMDFKTEDKIIEKMVERVKQGVFGYSFIPDEYFEAFSKWMTKRYHFPIEKEWVRFSNGLVTAINWLVNGFTRKGDAVLILTPVYYPFHHAVTNNARKLVTVDLVNDNGKYVMDYMAIEKAIVENGVKLFIQCSPHNPVGRVWTEEELDKILEICKEHHVLVVSDEIHQDITMKGQKFIPATVVADGKYRDHLITLNSASKTFNLAGLLHSHIIISDDKIREAYDEFVKRINQTEINIMGYVATQAGYEYGEEWLNNINEIIESNYNFVKKELKEKAPHIEVADLEGTYLLFLDLRKYVKLEDIGDFVQKKCKLAVDYGEWFGENFVGYIRLNLATHPEYVQKAVANIVREIQAL
ncbi:pyridoxal phosphate-dependent aminotransferase [Paenibacillus oralis]|uniref:cysteine-S-conjugate beta-lyase n=1 Tax=Paenibacillus oralis TaxID=2490856 RepID=A0A3P3U462_9BACL|nr:MalY/PatB family protein [Paenibacillus oralis]RRJ64586.1 pyridoxal phosphate-dependent aminotransferase [Paenibacillus oralis]